MVIEERLAAPPWEAGAKVAGIIPEAVRVHGALWGSVRSRQANKARDGNAVNGATRDGNAVNGALQTIPSLGRALPCNTHALCEARCFCCAGLTPPAILLLDRGHTAHVTETPAQVCAFAEKQLLCINK